MTRCSTVCFATVLASWFRRHRFVPARKIIIRHADEPAEQAVCAQLRDGHRGHIPDRDGGAGRLNALDLRALDLHCLQIWRSAHDLARIASGPLEQDLEA